MQKDIISWFRMMSMILKYKDFLIETDENVYEPSDDTYLLLDVLEKMKIDNSLRVLEIGCGTGIVSVAVSFKVGSVVACDVNPYAVDLSKKNFKRNKARNAEAVNSDLFGNVKGKFDVIVFNTPYLPQSDDEKVSGPIDKAWDGGDDGRKVIDKFLLGCKAFLADGGYIVFLESSLSSYEKSVDYLGSLGFKVEIVGRKKLSFEELVVIRARLP